MTFTFTFHTVALCGFIIHCSVVKLYHGHRCISHLHTLHHTKCWVLCTVKHPLSSFPLIVTNPPSIHPTPPRCVAHISLPALYSENKINMAELRLFKLYYLPTGGLHSLDCATCVFLALTVIPNFSPQF